MSMTGFGRGERHGEEVSVTVEVRTVNHRFLDLHTRCPGRFLSWEPKIRGIVRDTVRRGKVDLYVNVREWGKLGAGLRVDDKLLRSFLDEANRIRGEYGVGGEVTLRDLLAVPDLFQAAPAGDDPAEFLWPVVEGAVRDALEMLGRARAEEGDRMKRVLQESVARLAVLAREIRSLAAENREQAVARLRERIAALSAEAGLDPVRLHQEAAILLDRLDITEECDRLASHLTAVDALFRSPGDAVGKRFDFLVQEIFRELNTAGTKSAHAGVSALVVAAKTELEKVREQIQNIE
ncbi:MAG: YicC family protein [Deltaproteobacteria bacterium CG_4_9_14_3_um_filter_65_9]|nr:MAG: YicC family protein [Deltaproteobacteria bacterium CG_4_9_14_3_um_filter_65_9]